MPGQAIGQQIPPVKDIVWQAQRISILKQGSLYALANYDVDPDVDPELDKTIRAFFKKIVDGLNRRCSGPNAIVTR